MEVEGRKVFVGVRIYIGLNRGARAAPFFSAYVWLSMLDSKKADVIGSEFNIVYSKFGASITSAITYRQS